MEPPMRPAIIPRAQSSQDEDAVKGTNDDAAISKLSAVNSGYMQDEFVSCFVKRSLKRAPIINRGSYVRYTVLNNLIRQFLSLPVAQEKQIVSLGAGSDTRYFSLKKEGMQPKKYFEIDFMEITSRKTATIKKKKAMTDLIGAHQLAAGGTELHSNDYCIIYGDLRHFEDTIVPKLVAQGFDKSLPTLFISECVMIYMPPKDADKIIQWIPAHMSTAAFITYEQILPNDSFGRTMIENLKMRNIELPGIYAYPTLESQKQRYLSAEWHRAESMDVNQIFDSCLSDAEHARISRLEIFDELEEWKLLSSHYCVSWAIKAPDGPRFDDFGLKPASIPS
ncbi:hypothetical protein SmJEL517_g02181 [Synchytrium microbalum]|uniref:Leucine carboxyl methyltransferase 1 n=1 Tax=Synchytrium microbalum TaxID=1806994 RepID=A0A507CBX3_9FUNG|nr:uncharacterized protein SmJEL517_g02181 [Synchytrium microbalum]TPX35444.1 hypothetical protein SmJEL517_g02181 [Synchytrium microbalum]